MSSISVRLAISEDARREYAVRTGRLLAAEETMSVELDQLTAEERGILLAATGQPLSTHANLVWLTTASGGATKRFVASCVPETPAQWLTIAGEYLGALMVHRETIARKATEDALNRATLHASQIAAAAADVARLEGYDDASLLAGSMHIASVSDAIPGELDARIQALRARYRALYDAREAAEQAAKAATKAERDAARLAWVAKHGSDFLQRACAAGYNCQKRYVIERAALDHPGATVDFQDNANWKDIACPTEAGLDLAGQVGGTVVYLTREPLVNKLADEEYEYNDDRFEPREAVLLRGYLGKYDLFWLDYD